MEYHTINMDEYPRKEHFQYFSELPDPTLGITVKVDVSRLVKFCKVRDCSFYLAMTHVACLAANRIPQLRQRTRGKDIIEYSECGTSHIELLDNETYCYCTLWHGMEWEQFITYSEARREEAKGSPSLDEDDNVDALYFITCLPWLSYDQLSMPSTGEASDNPHFCWGRFEEDFKGRLMMPFTLTVNHALMDGIHISRFFSVLQDEIDSLP